MNVLIVGEAPGARNAGARRRISDLSGRPWEDWADWINLLDEWPGPGSGNGSGWNPRAGRIRARELRETFDGHPLVVLLGRRVAQCVLPAGAGLPWFRRVGRFVVIPHTSGIVRWWNDPENVERARLFLSGVSR